MQTKFIEKGKRYKVNGRTKGAAKKFNAHKGWSAPQIGIDHKNVEGVLTKKAEGIKKDPHLVKLDSGEIIECTSNGILELAGAESNPMVASFLDKIKAPKVDDPDAKDFVEGVEGLLEGFGIKATTVGDGAELKGIFIPYDSCKPLHVLIQEIFVESLKKGTL